MGKPTNGELLLLIAHKLDLINPRTGELRPRYQRLLNPPESEGPMTATEWRARFSDDVDSADSEPNPLAVPPDMRGDANAETLAAYDQAARERGSEFPARNAQGRKVELDVPPVPPPDDANSEPGE